MALKFMYITNDPAVAMAAENGGVDRIWIDLEQRGKEARQPGMDTVKSNHAIGDVARIRPYVKKAELMVRINPLFEGTAEEINAVVEGGADIVMLPMFYTVADVEKFVYLVGGRAKVMLLAETAEAIKNLESIVRIPGVDEIYIGLNDLHLSYGMRFMFQLLADGTVEKACKIIASAGLPYGFGGIARLGQGQLLAEYILGEHYRLGSSMVILSRSFCDTKISRQESVIKQIFNEEVKKIRDYEIFLSKQKEMFFIDNQNKVKDIIELIVKGE